MAWEGQRKFSHQQRSYLRKVFLYFLFNMLVVPGFSANAVTSFYEFFTSNWREGFVFLQKLFLVTSGDFFLSLLLQSGAGALLNQLVSLPMLFKNHLSPKIAYASQMYLFAHEGWRKTDGHLFQFGHYYAQMCVVVGILAVFW